MRVLTIDEKINTRESVLSFLEDDKDYIKKRLKERLKFELNEFSDQETQFILDCYYYRPVFL